MKITKKELKQIIKEEFLSEFWGRKKVEEKTQTEPPMRSLELGPQKISADWSSSGLTLNISVNNRPSLRLSSISEAKNLILFLEDLISGPMRTLG